MTDEEKDIEYLRSERDAIKKDIEDAEGLVYRRISITRYMPGDVGCEMVEPYAKRVRELKERLRKCEALLEQKVAEFGSRNGQQVQPA